MQGQTAKNVRDAIQKAVQGMKEFEDHLDSLDDQRKAILEEVLQGVENVKIEEAQELIEQYFRSRNV